MNQSGFRYIILEEDNQGICTISLNRPECHNAFNAEMIAELSEAFLHVQQSAHLRAMVLQAKGKSFCAGADINWMRSMAAFNYEENKQDAQRLALMFNRLYTIDKPTIAKVQGAVFGGAVGLIACCDIVIASKLSKYCLSEVKLGLVPATISPYVVEAIGVRHAKRYFCTAEVISARRARRIGLISETVSESELDSEVANLTQGILNNGPMAVNSCKQLIDAVKGHSIDQALIDQTSHIIARTRVSEEGQEGLSAFLEKRTPEWKPL